MKLDVLVVTAHPDDETHCMATIAKISKLGYKIGILDLTDGEPTMSGDPVIRREEAQNAAKVLGVAYREILNFKNRTLADTIETRAAVALRIRKYQPKIVFTIYGDPIHPDHMAIQQIVKKAVFDARLNRWDEYPEAYLKDLEKYKPHMPNRLFFFPDRARPDQLEVDFVVDVSDVFQTKIRAVKCYQSQFKLSQDPTPWITRLETFGRYWGYQIHRKYGEPFSSRRIISIEDPVKAFLPIRYG